MSVSIASVTVNVKRRTVCCKRCQSPQETLKKRSKMGQLGVRPSLGSLLQRRLPWGTQDAPGHRDVLFLGRPHEVAGDKDRRHGRADADLSET